MPWYTWVFEGIGTTIIGGIIGFFLGRYTKSKQIQKAGDNAKQKQSIRIETGSNEGKKQKTSEANVEQKQIAGKNAEQVQSGSVKHGQ